MIKLSLAFCCVMVGPVLAAPQAESGPTIRATVNEVALDLVVRDKKGRLVKNLKPGDVEIYEDGVRQEIRSLRLVGGEAPVQPGQPAPQPDRQSAEGQSETAEPARPLAMPLHGLELICVVFHQLDPNTRRWAVAAVQEFIKTTLRPGTFVGIFNLDSRLTPLHAFTNNRDELLRAATDRKSTRLNSSHLGISYAVFCLK